jgi:hypothetical protein
LRIALRIVFLLSIRSHTGQGCKTNTDVISSKHFYFINSMDVLATSAKNMDLPMKITPQQND